MAAHPSPRAASAAERAAEVSAAGCLVAMGVTFLPWGGSGDRRRTSYELVDVADRAGVVPDALAGWTWVWFLVPVLAGAAVIAAAARKAGTAGACSATLGALMVTAAVLVANSPLVTEFGATMGGIVGVATVAGGVTSMILGRSERAA